MNYHQLHNENEALKQENEALKQENEALREMIYALKVYLHSPKFQGFENNYVNPNDVLLRLTEVYI